MPDILFLRLLHFLLKIGNVAVGFFEKRIALIFEVEPTNRIVPLVRTIQSIRFFIFLPARELFFGLVLSRLLGVFQIDPGESVIALYLQSGFERRLSTHIISGAKLAK